MTDHVEVSTPREQSAFARAARLGIGFLLVVFSLGVLLGFSKASYDDGGPTLKGIAIIAVLVPGLLFLAWRLMRRGAEGEWLPRTPRRRSNRIVLYATLAMGAVGGMLMQIGEEAAHPGAGRFMPYDAPLHPTAALAMLATLPVLAWLYYRWHQSADEHDLAAYNFGGMLSLYAFFFGSVGWWIAWRGGFVTEPDGYALFWAVIVVWSLGWLWKKYR